MFLSSFEADLAELRVQNLYRQLRPLELTGPVRALSRGRELLLFCGNDYLGLSRHPRVIEAAKQALARFGTGAGAARLVSGTSFLHAELEAQTAKLKNKPQALVFSAGYLANLGVLSALAKAGDLIVLDKLAHASLIDGAKLSGAELRVFPHKNYDKLESILKRSSGYRRRLIVTDTVFSMDGDLADMQALKQIKEKYECLLIADDAHGTGVLGLEGRGALEDAGLESAADVITGTFSKALGSLGGFAAADKPIIETLINKARPFIFATALPPVLCAAIQMAITVFQEEPEIRHRLWRNIQRLHAVLKEAGLENAPLASPILPVVVGDEEKALGFSERLLERGFFVPAIRYPAVAKGRARLRLTVCAAHTPDDIEALGQALNEEKCSWMGKTEPR
ncbi:MAG: 8-amino-7-oxononanoate synthase [Omnitrophica bacterium GWA2_52_12]|nr:MAG: 8-amino-7-oxononanoate synthase [Omnitrophica bacterium GWA2_52_12]